MMLTQNGSSVRFSLSIHSSLQFFFGRTKIFFGRPKKTLDVQSKLLEVQHKLFGRPKKRLDIQNIFGLFGLFLPFDPFFTSSVVYSCELMVESLMVKLRQFILTSFRRRREVGLWIHSRNFHCMIAAVD